MVNGPIADLDDFSWGEFEGSHAVPCKLTKTQDDFGMGEL